MAAKKPRIEFVIDIDFIQKHPRSTKEDGIRWAHLLILLSGNVLQSVK